MNIFQIFNKEKEVWHERFIPSIVAATGVLIITLIMQMKGFDIVLLTSISASLVILTNKQKHQLTVIGTTIYSYILAFIVAYGVIFLKNYFHISLPITSFITITLIALVIYMFNIVHPPAIGIALGIVLYEGTLQNLLFIFGITFIIFLIVKWAMYLYYDHLNLKEFHHEFLVWKKKLFKK